MRRDFVYEDADFEQLAALAKTRTGISLSHHKKNMIYSRLAKRLRLLGLPSFQQYIRLLESDSNEDEIGHFVNAITTNLTGFFRESHHFTHLAEQVIPSLIANPPPRKRLRIWSAGCSSGMEPYSLAMTLHHHLPNPDSWDVRILATDIDTNMLQVGQKGIYPATVFEQTPEPMRKAYLEAVDSPGALHYRVSRTLRNMISFNQLNLMHRWPMKGLFDIVFCRNVVIYFDKETQHHLFERFADQMKPDSWLYIGHSENITAITRRFRLHGKTIYQRVC